MSVSGNIFTDGDFIGIQQTSDLSVLSNAVIGGKLNVGNSLYVEGQTNLNGSLSVVASTHWFGWF